MYYLLIIALLCTMQHKVQGRVPVFSKLNQHDVKINDNYLSDISAEEWLRFVQMGCDSVDRQLRFEENLQAAEITVKNGTLSHTQLLDTLAEDVQRVDNNVAKKMLKASQYAYNTKCVAGNIKSGQCLHVLANKPLPNGDLLQNCLKVIADRQDGQYPFRRLLPKYYQDGLYEMFSENKLPSPRLISSKALHQHKHSNNNNQLLSDKENLVLVQWTQFIEHDLSKPVVTSMSNGIPIECCNKNNYKLQPRYVHPACSPLLSANLETHRHGRQSCLNYVRSALVVGSTCSFSAVEQVNHATGFLDLSQLYGYTAEDQKDMRLFSNGLLKSRQSSTNAWADLLPSPDLEEIHEFCAIHPDKSQEGHHTCFMAGDNRVNHDPFSVIIYTIFMRNHNQLAQKLKSQHSDFSDDQLFRAAKAINIDIYRRIIFDEWLPAVLGKALTTKLKDSVVQRSKRSNEVVRSHLQISNEFAVAAIRFYFSMMPNALKKVSNTPAADSTLFVVKDQLYKPQVVDKSATLNSILDSLLQQRAMKVDYAYEESYVLNITSFPTHVDILAIDIQRGRDHGLQSYVKYLEECANVQIKSWHDLKRFMAPDDFNKLKNLYNSFMDIDLIVGGLAEMPQNGSLLGPTFSCILAEQFEQIHDFQHWDAKTPTVDLVDTKQFKSLTAFDLLCSNTELMHAPKNIFHQVSNRNPLVPCPAHL